MYTKTNVTSLADIAKIPEALVWGAVEEAYNANTNPFRTAGVVKVDPLLQARASGEGVRTEVQSWSATPYVESNISSDDPTKKGTPLKVATTKWNAARLHRNVGFSAMDLVTDLMAQDPLADIARRVAVYKNADEVEQMFAILEGLIAADVANGSKMTLTTDEQVSLKVILKGLNKLGDAKNTIKAFGMDSDTHLAIQLQQFTGYVSPADTNTEFGTLANRPIIVDDRFKQSAAGKARIVGLGNDLFHVGTAPASVNSVEVERDASAGNGRGQSAIWFRWQGITQPVGYSYEGTFAEVGGPSFEELAEATAFVRHYDVKKIPLVVIEAELEGPTGTDDAA